MSGGESVRQRIETVGLLLAAGIGDRLGGPVPKALLPLAGEPMVSRSLRTMTETGLFDIVVILAPPAHVEESRSLAESLGAWVGSIVVVAGGPSRQESVARGLAEVPADARWVVCHDAARPLASEQLFRAVVAALDQADGAVPVVPSPDTVKRVRDGSVIETLPRQEIGLAQTPQGFRAGALREAHRRARADALDGTDDAMLLERAGFRVVAVPGDVDNFKVTSPSDFHRAVAILERMDG
jgi:2-C-methyl-D-erythritol 4-phosphate cytidylyltransferase